MLSKHRTEPAFYNFYKNILDFFKVYSKPRIVAIFLLGFASGLPLALTSSTLSIWLKEDGLSLESISLFAAIGIPYSLKFLWAPLIDQLPIPLVTRFLGKRRGWMIVLQLLLIGSIIGLGIFDPATNIMYTAIFALFVAFFSASQDIVIDAYRVELLEVKQQGAGAAASVFGYRVGMLVSGAGALIISAWLDSWFLTYAIMAALILIGTITVIITGEPKKTIEVEAVITSHNKKLKWQKWFIHAVVEPFVEFLKRPYAILILFFILFYKFGDAFAGVMTNPFLLDLGFDKTQIAKVVKTYGFAATIIGSFLGGAMVNKLGIMRSLWICGILQMLSNLMFVLQAHIGYNIYFLGLTITAENLSGGMGTAAFVAYLSALCNLQYTATQYALLSSLASVGRTVLSTSSGWFVVQLGWSLFFILTTVVAIPGLVLLYFMQKHLNHKKIIKKL